MSRVFDRDAPLTVRAGAICVFLLALANGYSQLQAVWAGASVDPGWYQWVMRPALRLFVGVVWAWGIAQMIGVFYWSWLVISVWMLAFTVIVPMIRFMDATDIGAVAMGAPGIVVGLIWFVGIGLLLSPPSLRAYWRHGRMWRRSAAG